MKVVFARAGDGDVAEQAASGERLLDVAQRAGMPLEGTCNGLLACGTCHVLIAESFLPLLPPATDEEEDLIDLLPDATRRSRLACQIRLTDLLDGMVVNLPQG